MIKTLIAALIFFLILDALMLSLFWTGHYILGTAMIILIVYLGLFFLGYLISEDHDADVRLR